MGQILQTISVVIAALAFAYGVFAWRRAELGKRRIELAEETLALFYEVREALRIIRSPYIRKGEGQSRPREREEFKEVSEIDDRAHVVFERYDKKAELFARLASLKYRFRAYFGDGATKPFDEVKAIRDQVFTASRALADIWLAHELQHTPTITPDDLKIKDEAEAVIWESRRDDPLMERMDESISKIENICQAFINPRPTICDLMADLWAGTKRFCLCRD